MTKNINNKYLIGYCADPYYEELQICQIENSSGVTCASQDTEDFKASCYFTMKKYNLEMKDLDIPNNHNIRYVYANKWYFAELDATNSLEAIELFRHYIYQRLHNND